MTNELRTHTRNPLATAVITGVALIVVVLAVFAYASPYLVLSRLRDAVQARDANMINHYVDYPALRVSLKQQVTQMLSQRMDSEKLQHPLAALGALVGMAFVNPLVDAYATPDGVAALLKGMPPRGEPGEAPPSVANEQPEQAPGAPSQAEPSSSQPSASASAQANAPQAKANAGYRDMNTFAVTYARGATGTPYSVIFHRRGWFSWKIDAVELNP
jgi:hypothetical protein